MERDTELAEVLIAADSAGTLISWAGEWLPENQRAALMEEVRPSVVAIAETVMRFAERHRQECADPKIERFVIREIEELRRSLAGLGRAPKTAL